MVQDAFLYHIQALDNNQPQFKQRGILSPQIIMELRGEPGNTQDFSPCVLESQVVVLREL